MQLRFCWMVIVLALVTVVMVAGMDGLLIVTVVITARRDVSMSMPVAVVMNVACVMLRFDFVHQNRCRSSQLAKIIDCFVMLRNVRIVVRYAFHFEEVIKDISSLVMVVIVVAIVMVVVVIVIKMVMMVVVVMRTTEIMRTASFDPQLATLSPAAAPYGQQMLTAQSESDHESLSAL